MAAQDTHENTEEIIDLTELIEKGAVPEADTDASSPAAAQDDDLHTHMRSLNDNGQNVAADAEIDDLLAQMEYKDEGGADAEATPAAQANAGDGSAESGMESGMEQTDSDSPAPSDFAPVRMPDGHIVDPHEELHMPGIGDVDSLLNSLDIPPQPRPHEKAAPSPEDTDNAVDQMLGNLNGASRPSAENSSKGAGKAPHEDTTDLDELLAAGTMPEPVISDELESLLRESAPSANQPDAKQPQSKDKDQATPAAEPVAEPAPGSAAAQPQTPAQPVAPAAANPAQDAPPHDLNDDLDALLQSIMADKPGHDADKDVPQNAPQTQDAAQAQPAPASASAASADDLSADLDQLLSSVKPAAPQQPDPAPTADGGANQPADSGPAKANDKLEFDLDALLAAADAEERDRANPVTTPEAPAAEQPSSSLLPDVDLDDILAGNMVTAPSAMAGQAAKASQTGSAATPATPPASASRDAAGQAAVAADLTEIMARLDQYAEKLQQADDRVQALEAAVAEARAEADQARAEADAAKTAAQQIQSDLDEKLTAAQTSHESLAQTAAEALHTAQNAAQAAASATAQQQDQPDSTPPLEALFDTDHPLHQRLMDCVSTAAAEAAATAARQAAEEAVAAAQSAMAQANDAPAAHEDPALLESLLDDRMHAVNLTMHGASARLDAIESRLDELEPRFNDRVEKAAASAAARILREEIGRLLENE